MPLSERLNLTTTPDNPTVTALQAGNPNRRSDALLSRLADLPAVRTFLDAVTVRERPDLRGITAAAWPFLTALLHRRYPDQPLLAVTADLKQQEGFHQDLQTWLSVGPAQAAAGGAVPYAAAGPLFFPGWEVLPGESRLPHADIISERLECLAALLDPHGDTPAPVVVTQAVALTQRTFAPAELTRRLRVLRRGDGLDLLDLVEWLEAQGYEPEAQVTQKGELAVRGGIVDVFPLNSPWPVRLEFFGNTLDSLRFFDPATQLSREPAESVTFAPAGELGFLGGWGAPTATAGPPTPTRAGTAADPLGVLLDYLPPGALVLLFEPDALEDRTRHHAQRLVAGQRLHVAWPWLVEHCARRGLRVVTIEEGAGVADWVGAEIISPPTAGAGEEAAPPVSGDAAGQLEFESLDAYRPLGLHTPEAEVAAVQRRAFFGQLHRWLRQGLAVQVFCNNAGEEQRFREIWGEYGLDGPPAKGAGGRPSRKPAPLQPATHLGTLSRGFLCLAARLVVVTDAEIFGRYKVLRPRRLKSPHAATSRSLLDIDFTQLEEGDYVVHLAHGLGRYLGLRHLPGSSGDAGAQECLAIEYASREDGQRAPRLYVPVTEAHLVSKYVGAGKGRPPLNTLGGTRWGKAKAEAAQAVRDLAADMLGLQAARATQPGFAFPGDVPWQREFEGAFVYEETPDQMRAIEETKGDMEAARPMDRLICGDVGFGKTEVAIRAAFKAVMAGRQVGILVPTTVLAQQHYNTFRERMADYPVRIDLLSRFRTRRQQEATVAALAAGAVDIVIGTHRLLQPDVTFKDLGLVVVDEEQRFGVGHKERLKQLRRLVDVLTLTATPIPRTLYLALTGARDMSTIETPPQDRLPVETLIAAYDERLIRDAIQRELDRGGQVFYLHNRILDIDTVAAKLKALVPAARIAVGHGQMKAEELETVMTRFVNGEADVLLSTTIIESGIDIPNANTILIDRADRFGLSDLYQLRGRVGRYKHQAYAYLLIPRHAGLLADARKRITAIKQFSTPGSGYKIAMRDLEIRGAGNLLGAAQSGHITAVGFALYCQLLERSVRVLKGEARPVPPTVTLRLDFLDIGAAGPGAPGADCAAPPPGAARARAAFLTAYVPETQHRVELYRRLAQVTGKAGLDALQAEVRDRFGPPDAAAELLFQVTQLRLVAAERGINVIETHEGKVMLRRRDDFVMAGGKFPRLTKREPQARLTEIRKLLLLLPPVSRQPASGGNSGPP